MTIDGVVGAHWAMGTLWVRLWLAHCLIARFAFSTLATWESLLRVAMILEDRRLACVEPDPRAGAWCMWRYVREIISCTSGCTRGRERETAHAPL